MADEINNQEVQPEFHIQRVYTKDVSFEAPNTPHIFQKEWQPEVKLDMDTKTVVLSQDIYEVVLTLTVTCKLETETAFLCEVQQAGIFTVAGFDAQNTDGLLGTYAPNTLFPYARRAISDMVQDGGFPPFLLQPINFDQIYAEALRRRAQGEGQPAVTPEAGNA